MKNYFKYMTLFAAIAAFAFSAAGQTTSSTLVGLVTDVNGAVIAGAEVVVTQTGTNLTRTVSTNESGEYRIPQLVPGIYTIRVSLANFKAATSNEITLLTDTTVRVNIALEAGDIDEVVTVNAEPAVLNTETPEKGEVIVQRQIEELPLNGRDYTDLARLVPGIYPRPTEDDQGQGLASAGTRTDSTGFLLDGASNRDDRNGGVGVNTSVDAIQEFKVTTSTFSSEYGRLAGAQVSVITKSGSNRYSGSLFEFVRNDAFDALNYFTAPGEEKTLKRNQFGGSFGGPLPFINTSPGADKWWDSGKDKMFFFVSFEQHREVRSQAARTVAPHPDWAIGDFRNVRGAGNDGIWGNADDTNRVMCLQRGSNPLRPTKVECPTPNVLPLAPVGSNPNLLYASPISLAILQYLPRANDPNQLDGYNTSIISNTLPRNLFSVKVDRKLSESNNFYVRMAIDNRDAYQPQGGRIPYPGFLRILDYKNTSINFGDTHVFAPNLINDLRIGYSKMDRKTMPENNDQDYIALFGIPGLPNSSDPSLWGFPAIRIDGFPDTGDSANVPFNYISENFSIYNALTWLKGDHSFKFGVDVLKPSYNENDIRNVRGDFRFRGRFTNSANATATGFRSFADFLMGIPDSTQRQLGSEPADLTAWQTAFYIQDNWRAASWLTINLGLRYEYTPFLYEKSDRISTFIPEQGVAVCSTGEVIENGNTICIGREELGLGRGLIKTDKNNFAPRFGFALRPFNNDKSVVRGGIGIYYSTETINPARQMLANNYPYLNRQSFNRAATADTLQITFEDPFPENRVNLQGLNTPQGMPIDTQTPEVYQYNLTFEHELTSDLGWEIGYVGSKGRRLGMRYNLNYQYPTGTILASGLPETARRFSQFGDILYQVQEASSEYNALQTSIRRRSKSGLTLMASYTFGKAMDHNSNTNNSSTGSQRTPQDIYNIANDWALADYHRTHQFSGSFNYSLPFGRRGTFFRGARGLTDALIGGWQLNGIISMNTGRPFTPSFSTVDTAGGRPDLVGDPMANVPDGLYFNPEAFARPVATPDDPTLFGNAGRNIVIGPGYQNVDLSLFKNFRFAESMRLQLRWEVFNVLNRPNFQIPQFLLGSSDQGRLRQTAGEAREMQFAARFSF